MIFDMASAGVNCCKTLFLQTYCCVLTIGTYENMRKMSTKFLCQICHIQYDSSSATKIRQVCRLLCKNIKLVIVIN